ncbi:MAG: peptidoglycan DD-metalloendopeptidase family protein [Eubacterium sp.]|nr:peptidoglycan DD-metalloendopeptidase family protein [Eubacterium sp.]
MDRDNFNGGGASENGAALGRRAARYLRRRCLFKAFQALGTAAGGVAGPAGNVVGGLAARGLAGILAAGLFLVFFFLGCAIASWCPVIFGNVTLIGDEGRSEAMRGLMTGYGNSAAESSELTQAFQSINAGMDRQRAALSEEDQKSLAAAIQEPWDLAYLCAAYGVATELYANQGKNPEADMTTRVFEFLKNALVGYEVEVSAQRLTPAVYPLFEKREILLAGEGGQPVLREVYEKIGEAETLESREEPAYREIEVQPMAEENGESKMLEKIKVYEKIPGQTILYKPQETSVREKKHIRGALKKSTVLVSLGIAPEEKYAGEAAFSEVTNAEYAEYLREALVETLELSVEGEGPKAGQYLWPCPGYQEITSWFGIRPPEATQGIGSTDHGGIDIGAPQGAVVIAAAAGRVTQSGVNGGYGNSVTIDHGGVTTLYAHLSAIAAVSGQQVAQGEVIGWVGSTGNSTGPHLHLSAYIGGQAVDPLQLFTKAQHPFGLAEEDYGGVSGDVESWRPAAKAALLANGLSTEKWMVDKVLRQIATESGGNERAVQKIFDINSGTPIPFNNGICPWCQGGDGGCGSANVGHGLMQTIPSTFEAYAHAGHEDIFDGYDNLLAALCYAKARYGPQLLGLGEGHGY